MSRQNNPPPKGSFPYPRSPLAETAPHDPAHMPSHEGYPQSYEPPGYGTHPHATHPHTSHTPEQTTAPRDIFNALRPDQGLAARLEAFTTPTGNRFDPPHQDAYGHGQPSPGHAHAPSHAPGAQDGYGRGAHVDPAGQPYPSPGAYSHGGHDYDPYGRPLPGGSGYAAPAAYPADGAAAHDPRYFGGHHAEPALDVASRYPQAHGYATPHDQYGRDDAYGYDDPYRTDGAPQSYGGVQPGLPGAGQGADGDYYADDYADDGELETRRGPRAIVIVGALLAAIGLGGGLAYGYKSLTSNGGSGKLPILRADGAPVKALPADPGGKQVAHTDKKFLNRLAEDQVRPVPVSILPPPQSDREGSGDSSTRRVPTLVVNRDGSLAPTSSAPSPAPPPPVNRVPGMVIEGLTPRAPPPPPPSLRTSVAEEVKPELPLPAPRRVASAQPAAVADTPPPLASEQPRVAPEPKRGPPATRQAARTTTDAGAPAAAPAAKSGYVAVLSSRRSHMDALKSFADIQQKYTGVLQGRTPDVREANLGEKGIWYRVVVGPPGSRESANSVCSQLKSQGYTGCWIMTY